MYANIRFGKVKPGSADEIARLSEENIVPQITQAPGYRGYYLIHTNNDEIFSVTLFENKETAENVGAQGLQWIREHLGQYVEGQPQLVTGEVILHADSKVESN
jgi:heme-degrading monooxygenase HmoA